MSPEKTFEDLMTVAEDFTAMVATHKAACDGTVQFFRPTSDSEGVHATITDLCTLVFDGWLAVLQPILVADLDDKCIASWTATIPHVRQCLGALTSEMLEASFVPKSPQRKQVSDCLSLCSFMLAVVEFTEKVVVRKETPHTLTVESWCGRGWSFSSPEELTMNFQRLVNVVPHLVPKRDEQYIIAPEMFGRSPIFATHLPAAIRTIMGGKVEQLVQPFKDCIMGLLNYVSQTHFDKFQEIEDEKVTAAAALEIKDPSQVREFARSTQDTHLNSTTQALHCIIDLVKDLCVAEKYRRTVLSDPKMTVHRVCPAQVQTVQTINARAKALQAMKFPAAGPSQSCTLLDNVLDLVASRDSLIRGAEKTAQMFKDAWDADLKTLTQNILALVPTRLWEQRENCLKCPELREQILSGKPTKGRKVAVYVKEARSQISLIESIRGCNLEGIGIAEAKEVATHGCNMTALIFSVDEIIRTNDLSSASDRTAAGQKIRKELGPSVDGGFSLPVSVHGAIAELEAGNAFSGLEDISGLLEADRLGRSF